MQSVKLSDIEMQGAVGLFICSYKLYHQGSYPSIQELISQNSIFLNNLSKISKKNIKDKKSYYKINGPKFLNNTKKGKRKKKKKSIYDHKKHLRFLKINHRKEDEKLFECSFCDKKYLNKSSLNTHIKFHTGDLKFECKKCNKKFVHESKLNKHILYHHIKEKNYKCKFCKLAFKTEYLLKKHKEKHSKKPNYECKICFKNFKIRNKLIKHLQNHHLIKIRYKKYYNKL